MHEIAHIRSQMKATIILSLSLPSKRAGIPAGNGVGQGAGWLCKLVRDKFRTKTPRNSYPSEEGGVQVESDETFSPRMTLRLSRDDSSEYITSNDSFMLRRGGVWHFVITL